MQFLVFSQIVLFVSVYRNFCFCLSAPVLDESTVSQLCEMGFPLEACRKAVYFTGNTGIDAAMNWVMGHMDDAGKCPSLLKNKLEKKKASL